MAGDRTKQFTDDEVRRVIGRAIQLEEEARLWSEEDVLAIAEEAHIDGAAVLRALREGHTKALAASRDSFGLRFRWAERRDSRTLPSSTDLELLADRLRAVRGVAGTASLRPDFFEWRDAEGIQATVAKSDVGVGVTVTASRTSLAQSSASLFGVFGGLLGTIALRSLGLEGEQVILGLVGGVGVGLASWRLYWGRVSAAMRAKVAGIADVIGDHLDRSDGQQEQSAAADDAIR
ncbi:MAG: hypothetical protein ABFS34_05130 [Gemmatimonadota bacterium]